MADQHYSSTTKIVDDANVHKEPKDVVLEDANRKPAATDSGQVSESRHAVSQQDITPSSPPPHALSAASTLKEATSQQPPPDVATNAAAASAEQVVDASQESLSIAYASLASGLFVDSPTAAPHQPSPARVTSRQKHTWVDAQGNEKIFGSALGMHTRMFIDILVASPCGMVDMSVAAADLGVPKRRLYDITNVLEGVGFLEKKSKNTVKWKGSEAILGETIDPNARAEMDRLRSEISALHKEENRLDQWLSHLSRNQVLSQTLCTDDIVQAIFYPAGSPADTLPTKEIVLDETGKPKSVLIAIQAPLGSYAHVVPSPDGGPERHLYVGNQAGLARYNAPTSAGTTRQSPYAMTSGRVVKSARKDNQNLGVFVLPTYFDEQEQKLKTTGIRRLSDDPTALAAESDKKEGDNEDEEAKRQRSTSWDVAESMANDDGVSEFFDQTTQI